MKRMCGLALLGLILALPASLSADVAASGNWKLTTLSPMGNQEKTSLLIAMETADSKTSATLVAAYPPKAKVELVSFDKSGDRVRMVVKTPVEQVFEGRVSKDGKKIVGILGNDQAANAAYLAPTDLTQIDAKEATGKLRATPEELKSWADTASAVAKESRPHWAAEVNTQFAAAFMGQKNHSLAVAYANAAEKALDNKSSMDLQVKVLQTHARILSDAGKTKELSAVASRLNKLETVLDSEYMAKVPPFKGQMFAGRKEKSERVAVMELFTGAQCPPCVAADVAFDVLQKTYKPSELVLIQYHMHIPGPDPMTNTDTEARWKYYRDAFGTKAVGGTPTSLFNGTPKSGGGGSMEMAEKKYEAYRAIIDPLLETPAACKITASAKRVGDKVQIQADIAGLQNPGKDLKLRFVLVEETVRLVGVNKLRLHHQVVRAMPGGAEGMAMMKPMQSAKKDVDLSDLRKRHISYLDNYELTTRPFPQISRPFDMQNLRVIAFVQDDSTYEILQATQVDVVQ
jgi:hypothetical protein